MGACFERKAILYEVFNAHRALLLSTFVYAYPRFGYKTLRNNVDKLLSCYLHYYYTSISSAITLNFLISKHTVHSQTQDPFLKQSHTNSNKNYSFFVYVTTI